MEECDITYFDTSTQQIETIDTARLKTLWDEMRGFFWIDIKHPDINVIHDYLSPLNVDCVWTDHFQHPEILAYIHDSPSVISFYLYDVELVDSMEHTQRELQTLIHSPLLVIFSGRLILTYSQKPLDLLNYIKIDYEKNFKLAGKTPGFLVFLLIQHSLYNFARLNLINDNFLDKLEFGLLSGSHDENVSKIALAGYNILTLKKLNANLHLILLMLTSKQAEEISDLSRNSFIDLSKETNVIRDAIDSSRYLLDSIISGLQAEATHKTNQIVRLLTIISSIFMPLTLIASIFGMNFTEIPGKDWAAGFYLCLFGMGLIGTASLIILRLLGWIEFSKKK